MDRGHGWSGCRGTLFETDFFSDGLGEHVVDLLGMTSGADLEELLTPKFDGELAAFFEGDLAFGFQIRLITGEEDGRGEQTTPSGLSQLVVQLADVLERPSVINGVHEDKRVS